MYKIVIFDIDGTLIDTEGTGVHSLIRTVKELMHREMSYDEAYTYFGIPSVNVPKLLEYPEPEEFADLWERYFVELRHLMKIFPGISEMMPVLSEAGCKIGCVTSRTRQEFENDPVVQPLRAYFEVEICAEDSLRHKPDPEPALEYLKRSGAEASSTIYVGDTIFDCRCAKGAGTEFMLADWADRNPSGLPSHLRARNAEEKLKGILGQP